MFFSSYLFKCLFHVKCTSSVMSLSSSPPSLETLCEQTPSKFGSCLCLTSSYFACFGVSSWASVAFGRLWNLTWQSSGQQVWQTSTSVALGRLWISKHLIIEFSIAQGYDEYFLKIYYNNRAAFNQAYLLFSVILQRSPYRYISIQDDYDQVMLIFQNRLVNDSKDVILVEVDVLQGPFQGDLLRSLLLLILGNIVLIELVVVFPLPLPLPLPVDVIVSD